ncbi:MAG: AAA family ATPase [Acidobacteria bacterium]|nr:AAA family ATPase [Acidobacteriota bacterium]
MTDAASGGPASPVSTGTTGLDGLLHGGLPAHRLYLIDGDPGTGKTTLALQFLLTGRANHEHCLYVTLSETAAELRAVAASHGWSLDGIDICELARAEGRGPDEHYTLYHPSEIELSEMVKKILATTERVKPSRVVLDSLSEMRLLARDPLRYRRQVLALKEFFANQACTVLMLDDNTSGDNDLQLQSLAHGVVSLEQEPYPFGRSRRRLRVVKMRGVPAIEGFHDFRIHRGGIAVYPQLIPEPYADRPTTPVTSGVPELDRLLGGGLTWGTCTLVMGPAGSGKSTLAAQYVTSTAAETPAAMYLFDERRSTLLRRCEALGMDVQSRIASGHLSLEQIEPGDLSPGEFAHHVRRRVDEQGCRVVLIDSLNGYLHAIPTSHNPLVRMHELIAYLNERGVATLLIAAQHGIMGSQMVSPIDVSYLADCVIMTRYFEADGAVRKAISVVKKRTGAHESSIREYVVGPDRLRVGEPLSQFHGVLTGVPSYRGDAAPLLNTHDAQR